jgi:putative Mn2+ efflux pump MntP
MIGLLALPVLLSADNLVVPRALPLGWSPAQVAIVTALSSGMMSLLGLMLADLFRENREKAAYGGAISLILFVLAWIAA